MAPDRATGLARADGMPASQRGVAPAPARAVVLSRVDARMRDELPTRRLVARWSTVAGRVIARVAADASLVLAAAVLARSLFWRPVGSTAASNTPSVASALAIGLLALGTAGEFGINERKRHALFAPIAACIMLATVLRLLAVDGQRGWSGASLVGLTVLCAAFLGLLSIARRRLHPDRAPGVALGGALVVGRERDITAAIAALDGTEDHRIIDRLASAGTPAVPSLGTIARRLAQGDVQEVVVVSVVRALTLRAIAGACWAAGARCFVAFDARDIRVEPGLPTSIGEFPAVELVPGGLRMPRLAVKRALDVVITVFTLPIALTVGLLVGLAIRIESRGPVFFRQRRVGLGGREFVIWKFRSMRVGPEAVCDELASLNHYAGAPLFKAKEDPRITRVGRFLRRTSLDELPQLLNVLRGEMSLVGPRPPLPDEVARYAPHHLVRLTAIPGMTGPWQVGGRNLITDFEEIVRMERQYIDEWTLGLDLRILLRTVGVVVTGTGAY